MRKRYYTSAKLEASYKRAIRDGISNPIKQDYTMQSVNSMLYQILGAPGVSAGQSGLAGNTTTATTASAASSGLNTSAYTSAQADSPKVGGSSSATGAAAGIGLLRDVLAYYFADKSAKKAYERQNEFYDNHLSMSAKVEEYQEAGLNPMGLAGSGVGATSAPSVQSADTPNADGLINVLGSLLNYKTQMAQIEVDKERVQAQKDDIASRIEYRAEQRYYQQKVNEWFDANQIANISKLTADTKLALEKINTEDTIQRLNEAGIEKATAEAALSFQLALQKEWENSDAFRSNTIRLMQAQANANNANAAHAYEDIQNLATQRENIMQDTALKLAQTENGKQMLKNLGLTEEQLKFAVDHQKGDLIFNRINQVTNSLKDVGIAVGGVAGAATGLSKLAPAAKIIGFQNM